MVMSFDLLVALENKNRNSFLVEERKLNTSICHNDSAYLSTSLLKQQPLSKDWSRGNLSGSHLHPITSGVWRLKQTRGPKENPACPPDISVDTAAGTFPEENCSRPAGGGWRLLSLAERLQKAGLRRAGPVEGGACGGRGSAGEEPAGAEHAEGGRSL